MEQAYCRKCCTRGSAGANRCYDECDRCGQWGRASWDTISHLSARYARYTAGGDRKKVRFLAHCVEFLGLTNCRVEQARAECAGQHAEWREHFSGAVCRAVGTLAEILELATPFLKVGGCFFAIKGARATEEVTAAQRAAKELNLIIKAEIPLFPLSPTDSVIIQCEKNDHTPAMYPRRGRYAEKTTALTVCQPRTLLFRFGRAAAQKSRIRCISGHNGASIIMGSPVRGWASSMRRACSICRAIRSAPFSEHSVHKANHQERDILVQPYAPEFDGYARFQSAPPYMRPAQILPSPVMGHGFFSMLNAG